MDITIVLLEHGSSFREFWHKTFTDPSIFWVFLTAIATIALVLVGYFQLADLVRTRKSELLHKLQQEFFNPEAEALLRLIASNRLIFRNTRIFEVVVEEREVMDRIEMEIDVTTERILGSELVRLILNPFEYLAFLERKKIVIVSEVAPQFSLAIPLCWENEAVRDFISAIRAENRNPTLYQEFERLALKMERKMRERTRS